MTIKTFEDIIAWKKSKDLYVLLFAALRDTREYSFRDQLLRATLSISNNIAEGFDRSSNKELRHFLIIARGSAAEVRSMLIVSLELNIISNETNKKSTLLVKDISKLLTGFIKSIDGQQKTDNRKLLK